MNTDKAIRFSAKFLLYVVAFTPIPMGLALISIGLDSGLAMSHTTFLGFETTLLMKVFFGFLQSVVLSFFCLKGLGFYKK